MTYRTANLDRSYVCPGCGSPERALLHGGQVACSRCHAPHMLPDRSALPVSPSALQVLPDDPARIQYLRAQDGRPRQVPPTLQAVLGGMNVQPGREQEAIAIWQSLRARSQQGDVSASEDLTTLTLLIGQMPVMKAQPQLCEALSESAVDAAVLPRHRQEQLGRLVRTAIGNGDRTRAQQYLAWMASGAPELDMDSEARVSAAVVATLDGDGRRALALLGPRKDAIPIADSMDPLASVFRANAYEMLGDPATAAQILRELPDPQLLGLVRGQFPALQLCTQSGQVYAAATTQEAARRAASSAGNIGTILGGSLALAGLMQLPFVGMSAANLVIGAALLIIGLVMVARARTKGKHAAWLRTNGLPLTGRIINAQPTGTRINSVPVYRFALQMAGPQGPYAAMFEKLVPEHQVALLIGGEVRVRANPNNLQEVIPED